MPWVSMVKRSSVCDINPHTTTLSMISKDFMVKGSHEYAILVSRMPSGIGAPRLRIVQSTIAAPLK